MKGLRCTTTNCEFNRNMHCTAANVSFNKRGVCNTKMKREGGMLAQIFEDFETSKEFDIEYQDIQVKCDADCIYNVNRMCGRENITVEDSMTKTKCFTRKKPL